MKIRISILTIALFLCEAANAKVYCSGKPQRVYAGAHGPNNAGSKYFVVLENWQTYQLGDKSDDLAQARFSLAMAALLSDKELELAFYSLNSCATAVEEKALPTSVSIVK